MPSETSPNEPIIDEGQSGPDDGGYTNLVDEGSPEGFNAIMDTVTHESMGEIPPSHAHEDLRDPVETNEDNLPNTEVDQPVKKVTPLSEESFTSVEEKGSEREFLDPLDLTDDDLDVLARYDQTISEAATRVANATSYNEIEEESDELMAHINQIEEPIGKILLKRVQELSELAY